MRKLKLIDLAYARSGDKGDVVDIGIMAKDAAAYEILKKHLTADKVKAFFGPMVKGPVKRYDMDTLNSLEFVLYNALGGGATRTLAMDQTGKAYGPNMLRMEIEV
ncbi:MAG: hypothetical protein AB1814_13750 [Thermodesulfobacteriota bacterium]